MSSDAQSNGNGSDLIDILASIVRRRSLGEALSDRELMAAFPQLADQLEDKLSTLRRIEHAERLAREASEPILKMQLADPSVVDASLPSIPGYRIAGRVHSGGQGAVYRAIQSSTGREVAVKFLREGPVLGVRERIRFEREVRILGGLQHPNIVTIHDSGVAGGHYYLVMEFINGRSLDEYAYSSVRRNGVSAEKGDPISAADELDDDWGELGPKFDENTLGSQERTPRTHRKLKAKKERSSSWEIGELLRVFIKICRAVGAAHLKGVIHRDLKPSNILVDSAGEPHVLDFGLAKLMEPDSAEADMEALEPALVRGRREATMTGQFVGSVPWSSPEQSVGATEPLDGRTDVYSLGVILYYLLTHRFPYDVSGPAHRVLQNIAATEPVRPKRIRPELDDDIEVIVLKCLEKDPSRRYHGALSLADDLEKYLACQPISARAPSTAYQLRKLARRHRVPFMFLCALIFTITSAAAWLAVLYHRAAADRDQALASERTSEVRRVEAHAASETARFTREFLIKDVLGSADPSVAKGQSVTVLEALDRAAERAKAIPIEDPTTRAELHVTLGRAYLGLGQFSKAREFLEIGLGAYASATGHSVQNYIEAKDSLCETLAREGNFAASIEEASRNLERAREALGDEHRLTLHAFATHARYHWNFSNSESAAALVEDAMKRQIKALGPEDPSTLMTRFLWASEVLWQWKGLGDAERELRPLIEPISRAYGRDSPNDLSARLALGVILRETMKLSEADVLLTDAVSGFRKLYGEGNANTLGPMMALALLRREQNRLDEAAWIYQNAADVAECKLGADHPTRLHALQYLASVLSRQSRCAESGAVLEELIDGCGRTYGPDHVQTAMAEGELIGLLLRVGRFEEAEGMARHAFQVFHARDGRTSGSALWIQRFLARALTGLGRLDEARVEGQALLAGREAQANAENAIARDRITFARDLLLVEPVELRDPHRALEILDAEESLGGAATTGTGYLKALALEQMGRTDEALVLAQGEVSRTPMESSQARNDREDLLVRLLETKERADAALEVLRETLDARVSATSPSPADVFEAKLRLGEALVRHAMWQESLDLLGDCEVVPKAEEPGDWRTVLCQSLIGQSLIGLGRVQEGEAHFAAILIELERGTWIPKRVRDEVLAQMDLARLRGQESDQSAVEHSP